MEVYNYRQVSLAEQPEKSNVLQRKIKQLRKLPEWNKVLRGLERQLTEI